ncbi:Rieske 2Fe-2S domain-containing protein [Haloechinothrix salitolerans]|uniref:Rieske 2Fe-2S domain-containing protein n=1 Tax=Haloechinothrix salitolerans TaxID=926830 RepID=A0ABW2C672_9PSEU
MRTQHQDTATEQPPPQTELFERSVPQVGLLSRIRSTTGQQARELWLGALGRVPGLSNVVNRPEARPLRSSSVRMFRWGQAPYGTAEKPESLAEIPWDYIKANEDDIPFLGLREYWYPALKSGQLRHNESRPVTLLGDNIVLFRAADGTARALENRCPHRSALLSLGQVGAYEAGTITCRYHGMTFDGEGSCVAYLADGPDSPAIGKVRARSYPVEEHAGIIWVYMGHNQPSSLLDSQPHARSVLGQRSLIVQHMELPFSHLNMLDNATDLTHVGCLHRTCLLFGSQRPFGEIECEERGPTGLRASYTQAGEHPGKLHIDHVEWYLPNVVYHAPGDLGAGLGEGWFWFVPRDVGSFTAWLIIGGDQSGGPVRRAVTTRLARILTGSLFSRRLGPTTLVSCLLGGDVPMQASQGRVARWDTDRLARGDRSVARARRMVQEAHRAEVAERKRRDSGRSARTTKRGARAEQS